MTPRALAIGLVEDCLRHRLSIGDVISEIKVEVAAREKDVRAEFREALREHRDCEIDEADRDWWHEQRRAVDGVRVG